MMVNSCFHTRTRIGGVIILAIAARANITFRCLILAISRLCLLAPLPTISLILRKPYRKVRSGDMTSLAPQTAKPSPQQQRVRALHLCVLLLLGNPLEG